MAEFVTGRVPPVRVATVRSFKANYATRAFPTYVYVW